MPWYCMLSVHEKICIFKVDLKKIAVLPFLKCVILFLIATTQDNLDDKLRKFEIRDMMGLTDDRDISETVSETWSTDVLGSDFDPNIDEDRLQEIAGNCCLIFLQDCCLVIHTHLPFMGRDFSLRQTDWEAEITVCNKALVSFFLYLNIGSVFPCLHLTSPFPAKKEKSLLN